MTSLDYITKKYRLNLSQPLPIEIAQLGLADLAGVFAKLGFTKGAIVGTWQGAYSQVLCKANPQLKLFGIDLDSGTSKKAIPAQCKLIHMASLDAANKCVDASLDFVYLDTHHDFTQTASDINMWAKKVRPGGIVAGHDYFRYRPQAMIQTHEALTSYTGAYKIAPWFVIGRNVDRIRSWFWVKA